MFTGFFACTFLSSNPAELQDGLMVELREREREKGGQGGKIMMGAALLHSLIHCLPPTLLQVGPFSYSNDSDI